MLGPELDWRLLAPVDRGRRADVLRALRAAVGQALLVADGPALRWPHALTRDAVLATLLPPERAALAGRAARVLAERAGPDDEPRAAELFVEAGETDAAVALLLRLARRDAARGALRSAEHLLAAAAAAAAGTRLAAAVTAERVTVLTLVGRAADALALGDAELDGLRGDAHAELCLQLARTAITAGAWADAEAYVARAGRPGDPRSLVLRADAAFGAGRAVDAGRFAAAAIARAEQVLDEHAAATDPQVAAQAAAALCEALGVAGRLAWGTDLDVTEALARRAAQVAGEHGLVPWRVTALFQLGMMSMLRAHDTAPLLQARELALDARHARPGRGHRLRPRRLHLVGRRPGRGPADGPRLRRAHPRACACPQRAFSARSMLEMLEAAAAPRRRHGHAVRGAQARRRHRVAGWRRPAARAGGARRRRPRGARPAARGRRAGDRRCASVLQRTALIPPLPYLGASALVDAAIGREAEWAERSYPVAQVPANRGAFAWADAIAAGRAGRRDEAAALLAEGDAALAGLPWWRRLLRTVVLECAVTDGWGDPVPDPARRPRRPRAGRRRPCSPAPAVTCSAAPAPRPRARARAPSWPPGCAPAGSRRARPRCWGWSRRA